MQTNEPKEVSNIRDWREGLPAPGEQIQTPAAVDPLPAGRRSATNDGGFERIPHSPEHRGRNPGPAIVEVDQVADLEIAAAKAQLSLVESELKLRTALHEDSKRNLGLVRDALIARIANA